MLVSLTAPGTAAPAGNETAASPRRALNAITIRIGLISLTEFTRSNDRRPAYDPFRGRPRVFKSGPSLGQTAGDLDEQHRSGEPRCDRHGRGARHRARDRPALRRIGGTGR